MIPEILSVTEMKIVNIATGFDAIPAWYLRLGARLTVLITQTFSVGVVPQQCKVASVTPVTKVTKPVFIFSLVLYFSYRYR